MSAGTMEVRESAVVVPEFGQSALGDVQPACNRCEVPMRFISPSKAECLACGSTATFEGEPRGLAANIRLVVRK